MSSESPSSPTAAGIDWRIGLLMHVGWMALVVVGILLAVSRGYVGRERDAMLLGLGLALIGAVGRLRGGMDPAPPTR